MWQSKNQNHTGICKQTTRQIKSMLHNGVEMQENIAKPAFNLSILIKHLKQKPSRIASNQKEKIKTSAVQITKIKHLLIDCRVAQARIQT